MARMMASLTLFVDGVAWNVETHFHFLVERLLHTFQFSTAVQIRQNCVQPGDNVSDTQ